MKGDTSVLLGVKGLISCYYCCAEAPVWGPASPPVLWWRNPSPSRRTLLFGNNNTQTLTWPSLLCSQSLTPCPRTRPLRTPPTPTAPSGPCPTNATSIAAPMAPRGPLRRQTACPRTLRRRTSGPSAPPMPPPQPLTIQRKTSLREACRTSPPLLWILAPETPNWWPMARLRSWRQVLRVLSALRWRGLRSRSVPCQTCGGYDTGAGSLGLRPAASSASPAGPFGPELMPLCSPHTSEYCLEL